MKNSQYKNEVDEVIFITGGKEMKTFSEKTKEAREELKLNQQQLGELVGVSKRSIAAYETTDTKPRGNIARKLAAALQVSVDYLLNDEINIVVAAPRAFRRNGVRGKQRRDNRDRLAAVELRRHCQHSHFRRLVQAVAGLGFNRGRA